MCSDVLRVKEVFFDCLVVVLSSSSCCIWGGVFVFGWWCEGTQKWLWSSMMLIQRMVVVWMRSDVH